MNDLVFISYNRGESNQAFAVADALRAAGVDVWIDQRSIPVSVPWMAEIEAGIRKSALVLVLESAAWRESENCAAEIDIAHRWSVRSLHVEADDPAPQIVGRVLGALENRDDTDRRWTELVARAGDWDDAERPDRALVRGKALKDYVETARNGENEMPAAVAAFLAASEKRQRRNRFLRRSGAIAAVLIVYLGLVTYGALHDAQDSIDDNIASFAHFDNYRIASDVGQFEALDYAAQAYSEGTASRLYLLRALALPTPIAAEPAADLDPRRVPAPGVVELPSPDGTMIARIDGDHRTVTVDDGASVHNIVRTGAPASGLAWSPDGDWVAVGVGRDIMLLDARFGNDAQRLRGADAVITAIDIDDDAVRALTADGRVVTWPSPFIDDLAAVPDTRWVDAVPLPGTDLAAIAAADGTVATVDRTSGETVDILTLPGDRLSIWGITADPGGDRIAAVGAGGEEPVVVVTDRMSADGDVIQVGDCVPKDAAFAPNPSRLLVACGQNGIGVVDLDGGTFSTVATEERPVSIEVRDDDDTVLVGTATGSVIAFDPGLHRRGWGFSTCNQDVTPLVMTTDGRYAFHGGGALAIGGCATRIEIGPEGRIGFDHLVVPWQHTVGGRAVALNKDDTMVALGFADGGIRVYDTTGNPLAMYRPGTGAVRGLAFDRDSSRLLVASSDGSVYVQDLSLANLTHAEQAAEAARRVDIGVSAGLYAR